MVRVFAKAKSKAGCEDALRAILQKLMKSRRTEAGVLTYDVFESKEQGEFLFREEYAGAEEFEAHKRSRHLQVAVARAAPFMDGPLALWIVEPVSSENLPSDISS